MQKDADLAMKRAMHQSLRGCNIEWSDASREQPTFNEAQTAQVAPSITHKSKRLPDVFLNTQSLNEVFYN
jgi:hypothetical protein